MKNVPMETVVIGEDDIQQSNAQNAIDVLKTVPGSVHDDVLGTYSCWRRIELQRWLRPRAD
ncbi:MAG: hypothetical protein ACTFAK_03790 [Candidatus Electronema sp. VV]